jgi:Ribbon-helix-helix protein, copG family
MLRLEARTVHLQEFEIQLLNKLSAANGKTVEELLRDYIRTGLTKERHEGVSSYLKHAESLRLLAEG